MCTLVLKVIQQRGGFNLTDQTRVNFTRSWEVGETRGLGKMKLIELINLVHQDYKHGFGDLSEEFWFGNQHIHQLTSRGNKTLRVEMKAHDGRTAFAEYSTFRWLI